MTVSKFLKKYVRKNRAYEIYNINTGEKLYYGLNSGSLKKKLKQLEIVEISARGIKPGYSTIVIKIKET